MYVPPYAYSFSYMYVPSNAGLQGAVTSVSRGRSKSNKVSTDSRQIHKAKAGRFTKSFDKALPGPHTRLLYNGRVKLHANILCQLRSGVNQLNKYLAKIKAVETEQCKCSRGGKSLLITFCSDAPDAPRLRTGTTCPVLPVPAPGMR